MKVKPMLGDWEIPHIAHIRTEEMRKLSELRVPGRRGSVFQDLGAEPVDLEIAGSVFAQEARSGFLESARQRFEDAKPISFVADILEATEVQFMLIQSLVIEEHAEHPDEFLYHIHLRESPPPPPPTEPFGAIDSDLLDQAAGFVDGVADALDAVAALGDIPDFSDPSSLVGDATADATALVDGIANIGPAIQSLFGGT
jgi:hypothetical protein